MNTTELFPCTPEGISAAQMRAGDTGYWEELVDFFHKPEDVVDPNDMAVIALAQVIQENPHIVPDQTHEKVGAIVLERGLGRAVEVF